MLCKRTNHVCNGSEWYLLFLLEPICQTQSIVELRFSSVKIKQLHLLLVSTSKRNPRRMQLSQRFEIGFWLILDYRFPDFCFSVFPGFVLSGLCFTLHLTLQGRLNRRFIRGCSSEISILLSKMKPVHILYSWFSDSRANPHLWQLFYRAI